MTDQYDIKTWAQREAELLKGKRPCPFCGSARLSVNDWSFEDGDDEYPVIECLDCKGAAPAVIWNLRRYTLDTARRTFMKLIFAFLVVMVGTYAGLLAVLFGG